MLKLDIRAKCYTVDKIKWLVRRKLLVIRPDAGISRDMQIAENKCKRPGGNSYLE